MNGAIAVNIVIPAKVGIQVGKTIVFNDYATWVPAFAGMIKLMGITLLMKATLFYCVLARQYFIKKSK